MENASKALIIAGAILLSILIIGIGMFIYNQAAAQIQDTGLDEQAIDTFNQKFLAYEGKVSGAQASKFCDLVRSNNSTFSDDQIKQIKVTYGTACTGQTNATAETADQSSTAVEAKKSIKSGRKYEITFDYSKSGMIVAAGITDVTN